VRPSATGRALDGLVLVLLVLGLGLWAAEVALAIEAWIFTLRCAR
jgi:hypothetical protein